MYWSDIENNTHHLIHLWHVFKCDSPLSHVTLHLSVIVHTLTSRRVIGNYADLNIHHSFCCKTRSSKILILCPFKIWFYMLEYNLLYLGSGKNQQVVGFYVDCQLPCLSCNVDLPCTKSSGSPPFHIRRQLFSGILFIAVIIAFIGFIDFRTVWYIVYSLQLVNRNKIKLFTHKGTSHNTSGNLWDWNMHEEGRKINSRLVVKNQIFLFPWPTLSSGICQMPLVSAQCILKIVTENTHLT